MMRVLRGRGAVGAWQALVLCAFAACADPAAPPSRLELAWDFTDGAGGWNAGFADFPVADAPIFELDAGIRALPSGFAGQGFLLAGSNRSDDLFMFLERRVGGLEPGRPYRAWIDADLLSSAGAGCVGIGGAPGESVYVKFGHAAVQPRQDGYGMNIDHGIQSQDGANARVVGNVAIEGIPCSGGGTFGETSLTLDTDKPFRVRADAGGGLWFLVGTDSGFEGRTTLYWRRVRIILEAS